MNDYVAELGYERTETAAVQCAACDATVRAEGDHMRSHRRRCPVAPAEVRTPGVCNA
jgi:hypothetical protein